MATITRVKKWTTMEIRCPKCRSPCLLEDGKNQQYKCRSCDTAFRFIETITKKNKLDIIPHDCPECGKYVKPGTGFACSECGKANLCSTCIIEKGEEFICNECLTKNERKCDICGKVYVYRCGVCGIKRCSQDYHNFNIEIKEYSRVLNKMTKRHFSLYCPSCQSPICGKCYKKKERILMGGLSLYCKKCGSKLSLGAPHSS